MNKISDINALHHEAMEKAGQAFHADIHGDYARAETLFREAFDLERQAASLLIDDIQAEPSRAILLRSAASLALDCHEYREAERLVAIALSGSPPDEIGEELRDLLETIYFSRHLSLRGLEMDPGEFQMTLVGGAVGFGIVESGQFLRRAEIAEKMLVRTTERLRGLPFRETGSPSKEALQGFEVFFSTPRAASFAISIRLGRPQRQLLLPGFAGPKEVVDDFLTCVSHFNASEADALQQHIPSEAYYNNFTALARKLAPDGEKITTVGLTAVRGGETREVALSQPPSSTWRRKTDEDQTVVLVGRIRSADESSTRKRPVFGVEEDNGVKHNVAVPPGLLQDIVRPYWGERVRVVAVHASKTRLEMVDIEQSEPSVQPTSDGNSGQ